MRIAHVITRLIVGGAQENTLLTCADLMRIHGDDVLLVTGPPLGPEGSLLDEAQRLGVPLAIVDDLRRAIHPWRDLVSYRAIKRKLAEFQPQIVHTHSAKAGILGRRAARALRVPGIVHGVHGAPWHPYQGRGAQEFFKLCERRAAPWCDHYIGVADAMRDLMVSARVAPPENFTTIYSGMDVEPFLHGDQHRARVRRELGYRDDEIVVGKIARLFHLKGHADVIRAAEAAVARVPNLRFLFVGEGILRSEIERMIADRGLARHFQFTGLVPPGRIPELIAGMDLLVHASLREGLARALPQGLISAKPVISYDIDGAREVVISGETGFLLAPGDTAGMASAIVELAENRELRERLGQTGRARFTEVFRHERMTRETRAIYERLLAG